MGQANAAVSGNESDEEPVLYKGCLNIMMTINRWKDMDGVGGMKQMV